MNTFVLHFARYTSGGDMTEEPTYHYIRKVAVFCDDTNVTKAMSEMIPYLKWVSHVEDWEACDYNEIDRNTDSSLWVCGNLKKPRVITLEEFMRFF